MKIFPFFGILKNKMLETKKGTHKNISVTHKWVPTQCLGNSAVSYLKGLCHDDIMNGHAKGILKTSVCLKHEPCLSKVTIVWFNLVSN